mgnify:CR=1 FL=1
MHKLRDAIKTVIENYGGSFNDLCGPEIFTEMTDDLLSAVLPFFGTCECQCHRNGGLCVHGKCCDGGPR